VPRWRRPWAAGDSTATTLVDQEQGLAVTVGERKFGGLARIHLKAVGSFECRICFAHGVRKEGGNCCDFGACLAAPHVSAQTYLWNQISSARAVSDDGRLTFARRMCGLASAITSSSRRGEVRRELIGRKIA
jgi:hypothetical protein